MRKKVDDLPGPSDVDEYGKDDGVVAEYHASDFANVFLGKEIGKKLPQ